MTRSLYNPMSNFPTSAGLGLISGCRPFHLYGEANNLVKDIEFDITRLPGNVISLPDAAGELLEIVSDDPLDIGDRILIEALKGGGEAFEIDIDDAISVPRAFSLTRSSLFTLNGTTPVLFPENVSRINSAQSIGIGFNGTLSIQQAGGGIVFGKLFPEDQQMNQAFFTVPAKTMGIVGNLIGSLIKPAGDGTVVKMSVVAKGMLQTKYRRGFGYGLHKDGANAVQFHSDFPEALPGPLDIKITAETSQIGASVTAWLSGVIIDD